MKFTTRVTREDLEQAISDFEKIESKSAQIALLYLKKELKRRVNAGRPLTSKLNRKEQVREAVKRHREKKSQTLIIPE